MWSEASGRRVWETSVLRGAVGRAVAEVGGTRQEGLDAAAGTGEPVRKGCLLKPYQGV